MKPHSVNSVLCPACHAEVDARELLCPYCGSSMFGDPPAAPAASRWSNQRLLNSPLLILALLFFVTLFLGLPLLWRSTAFSREGKTVVTVLVLIWTSFVFWLFYLVMHWSISRILHSL